jgi:geranylgeranyl pyrophosphate synthase
MHSRYGIPTAINVGDYLVGMGYRLVSQVSKELGAEKVVDLLDLLADAHQRLAEGQGAELLWRDSLSKRLRPIDALKIYALKTSPAFEAAFFCGLRLAGEISSYIEPIKSYARNLGVAFQILNDLKDWQGDSNNKLDAGGDIIGGRPTVLWALALEGLGKDEQAELEQMVEDRDRPVGEKIHRVKYLYEKANVFEQANQLVDKHQQRAEAIAESIQPEELRQLLFYLIDTVLERQSDHQPTIQIPEPSFSSPLSILPQP